MFIKLKWEFYIFLFIQSIRRLLDGEWIMVESENHNVPADDLIDLIFPLGWNQLQTRLNAQQMGIKRDRLLQSQQYAAFIKTKENKNSVECSWINKLIARFWFVCWVY